MRDRDVLPRVLGVFLVFVGAGPLIGGFVFGLMWVAQVLLVGPDPWRMAYVATPIYSALLGYLVGFGPALVIALAAIGLSLFMPSRRWWILAVTVFGCGVGIGSLILMGHTYPPSMPGAWAPPRMLIIAGVSSLACAYMSESFRPVLLRGSRGA